MDPLTLLHAVIIGIVEGLTEFLPVSSTGHILITQRLLDFSDPGEVFAVVIQLGAILAVCWVMRGRLVRAATQWRQDPAERRFLLSVAAGSLPAGVVGFLANDWLESHVFTPDRILWIIAGALVVGGVAILAIERLAPAPRHQAADRLPWRVAVAVGACQILAMLLPGLSRSGATIMGALCLGVSRRAATEFTFFLAIPVMLGASVLKLVRHHDAITLDQWATIGLGFTVSFLVAWAAVAWLLRWVSTHTFTPFAWYRIVVGGLLLGALVMGWF
jgi:undecaprenyl-diphosphatase